jgi:hypothetical protein
MLLTTTSTALRLRLRAVSQIELPFDYGSGP